MNEQNEAYPESLIELNEYWELENEFRSYQNSLIQLRILWKPHHSFLPHQLILCPDAVALLQRARPTAKCQLIAYF